MSNDSDRDISDSDSDRDISESDSDRDISESDSDRDISESDSDRDISESDSDRDISESDSDPSVSDSASAVRDHGEIQNECYEFCYICQKYFCEKNDENHESYRKIRCTEKDFEETKMSETNIEKQLNELANEIAVNAIHQEMFTKVRHLTEWFQTRIKVQYLKPKGTIRIASWNIHHAASKMHIDCMQKTIRKNNFDIVALQEAGKDGKAAKQLCDALKKHDDKWKLFPDKRLPTHLSGVFLMKESSELKKIEVKIMDDCKIMVDWNDFANKPCLGIFSISDWMFALLNFHLKPRSSKKKIQSDNEIGLLMDACTTAKTICEKKVSKENIILLGDFNNIPQNVKEHGYVNTFGFQEYTNTKKDDTYDNIIVHHTLKQYCMGHGVSEIVTKKTTSPTDVSDHCPIWADFIYE